MLQKDECFLFSSFGVVCLCSSSDISSLPPLSSSSMISNSLYSTTTSTTCSPLISTSSSSSSFFPLPLTNRNFHLLVICYILAIVIITFTAKYFNKINKLKIKQEKFKAYFIIIFIDITSKIIYENL